MALLTQVAGAIDANRPLTQQERVSKLSTYTDDQKQKGWNPATTIANPDGSVTVTKTGVNGGDPYTVTVFPDGSYQNYDKSGYGAKFDASGNLVPGSEKTEGAASSLYAATGLPTASDVRGFTDDLGLTVPDPSEDPAYQQLVEAANAFKGAYGSAGGGVTESRAIDMGTIDSLRAAAEGRAPSAAQLAYRGAIDNNARQALGLASTLGGSNPGGALREGLAAFQDTGARSAADMAALRAREQEAARAQLAQQTAALAQRDVVREGSQGSLYAQTVGAPYAAKEKAQAANQGLFGNIIGSAVKASDERTKTNIRDGTAIADEFLASLTAPKTYEYKDPGPLRPPGQQLGPMAQDLPKRDVVTGPDGTKYIDASVMSDMLAGMGRLHDRLSRVEGKPQGGTVAGSPREYEAAMNYVTAPRVNADSMSRVAAGRPPGPSTADPSPDGMQVPPGVLRAYLSSLGLVTQ